MNFDLNEEQEMIVSTVRSFVENEIYSARGRSRKDRSSTAELGEEIKRKCIELGFYACNFPRKSVGAGLSTLILP